MVLMIFIKLHKKPFDSEAILLTNLPIHKNRNQTNQYVRGSANQENNLVSKSKLSYDDELTCSNDINDYCYIEMSYNEDLNRQQKKELINQKTLNTSETDFYNVPLNNMPI